MEQKTIIIICGPTAVGKTAVAIRLAQTLHTQIISADSRQCFREMNIGVAKPSKKELAAVHHFFIDSHSVHDEVNAVVFEEYALRAAAEIFAQSHTAVMVGGTGLYIKAFCEGLDDIPTVQPEIRREVMAAYEQHGLMYLQEQLKDHDPAFWAVAEQQNPQRLMRALEVLLSTGQSISTFRSGNKVQRPFRIIKIGLELPREELYNQINNRVDAMIAAGLEGEATELYANRHLNALQTVGYSEMFDYMDGKLSLNAAIEEIKKHTRHYAKRQMTWFKRDPAITWMSPSTLSEEILSLMA